MGRKSFAGFVFAASTVASAFSATQVLAQEVPSAPLPSAAWGAPRGPSIGNTAVIREPGEYDRSVRTLVVYSSACDDYVAEECGLISFACQDAEAASIEFFGVESFELAAMLQIAASAMPDRIDFDRTGIERALEIATDTATLDAPPLMLLAMSYNLQFSYWSVGARVDIIADLTEATRGAQWLKVRMLGMEVVIENASVLLSVAEFLRACPR